MDHRLETVIVETDRYRIEGKLTLPREGYRSRLSDYVNQRDRDFFAFSEATMTPLSGDGEPRGVKFLMVARRHVVLVTPGSGEDT
ncbi:MAG: hypothetical protein QOJ22_1224 [Thermoleophilaceae bacterium]|nr:hypothetical protein [Thermoleophilaceae bacterium]